jgi:acyl-CoA reductase-like NAD-dependent aldehyde dehydrogenase
VPIGVVAAIAPFNFPLNLVAHKVAPAIAVGCPVVLKPASQTPLSSLLLADMLTEAGLPPGWLNVVPGGGAEVGDALVLHPEVNYITFTGSPAVGWGIAARAPKKKVRLELGSNAPLIVDDDSDWETAAAKAASAGFVQAGQSCVSTQRIFVHAGVAARFRDALVAGVAKLRIGEPLAEDVDVSALISDSDALRVESWVHEAIAGGARADIGGERIDNVVTPTVLSGVTRSMRVQTDEIFGPVVTVTEFDDFDTALDLANDSLYGLNAGVYTNNVAKALKAARRLEFGSVYVNDVPTVRADQQPYGGVKDSGNTREGPRYAMSEMTEPRLVTIQ